MAEIAIVVISRRRRKKRKRMKKRKGKKTVDDEENRGGRGSDEDDSETEEARWKVREARFKQKVSLVALRAATLIYASSHRPKSRFEDANS